MNIGICGKISSLNLINQSQANTKNKIIIEKSQDKQNQTIQKQTCFNILGEMKPTWLDFIISNQMNCIIDSDANKGGLYLGNIDAAYNIKLLQRSNIRAVLTVARSSGLQYAKNIIPHHLIINAEDNEYFDLSKYFTQIIDFIEKHIKNTNVLVHCFAGISRSSTSVIAYLMKTKNWSYEKSFFIANKKEILLTQIQDSQINSSLFGRKLQSANVLNSNKNLNGQKQMKQQFLSQSSKKHEHQAYGDNKFVQNVNPNSLQPKVIPLNIEENNSNTLKNSLHQKVQNQYGNRPSEIQQNLRSNSSQNQTQNKNESFDICFPVKSSVVKNEDGIKKMNNYNVNKERSISQYSPPQSSQVYAQQLNQFSKQQNNGKVFSQIKQPQIFSIQQIRGQIPNIQDFTNFLKNKYQKTPSFAVN